MPGLGPEATRGKASEEAEKNFRHFCRSQLGQHDRLTICFDHMAPPTDLFLAMDDYSGEENEGGYLEFSRGDVIVIFRGTDAVGEMQNRFAGKLYAFGLRPDATTGEVGGAMRREVAEETGRWVPRDLLKPVEKYVSSADYFGDEDEDEGGYLELRKGEDVLVYKGTETNGRAHNLFPGRPYVFGTRPNAAGRGGWMPCDVLRRPGL